MPITTTDYLVLDMLADRFRSLGYVVSRDQEYYITIKGQGRRNIHLAQQESKILIIGGNFAVAPLIDLSQPDSLEFLEEIVVSQTSTQADK